MLRIAGRRCRTIGGLRALVATSQLLALLQLYCAAQKLQSATDTAVSAFLWGSA